MATAFTQPQLDALEQAIATGAYEITYEGKTVRYRSLDEMQRIREIMRSALGLSASGARYTLTGFTKDSSSPPPRTNFADPFGQNLIG